MNVFASVGILLFSAIIVASSQLVSGVFLILYHSLLGRFSRKRASDLALFFIIGVEITLTLLLLSFYAIFNYSTALATFYRTSFFPWFTTIIILFYGVLYYFCYTRRGRGSKLFIPRSLAERYHFKADSVKTRSDALMLGLSALLPELAFNLPILILTVIIIANLGPLPISRATYLIIFVLIAIAPLLILHTAFSTGHHLVDLIKFRMKNQLFLRIFVTLAYLSVAFFLTMGVYL